MDQAGGDRRAELTEAEAEDRLCVICLVNERDTTVLPCRHMCMCHVRRLSSSSIHYCHKHSQKYHAADSPCRHTCMCHMAYPLLSPRPLPSWCPRHPHPLAVPGSSHGQPKAQRSLPPQKGCPEGVSS